MMETADRQQLSRKARRKNARAGGVRASPTFIAPPSDALRVQRNVSSAPGNIPQSNSSRNVPQDRVLQSLSALTGTTVTISTKTLQRFEGVVASTRGQGDTTGVTLKGVKDITTPGAPLKHQLFIASTNIDTWLSGPADAEPMNGNSELDIAIGGVNEEVKYEAVVRRPNTYIPPRTRKSVSFSLPVGNAAAASTATANIPEHSVNGLDGAALPSQTQLPSSSKAPSPAPDKVNLKPKDATANANINVDDSGVNEEDKYEAVVQLTNAYIPSGERKSVAFSPPVSNAVAASTATADIPDLSVNRPHSAALPSQTQLPSSSKAPSPVPEKPSDTWRDFITTERQRLAEKRKALAKSEIDKRKLDLVEFSQNFKLNKPLPDDLVPILAKDEEKQRVIREKASIDAASPQARRIGAIIPANAAYGPGVTVAKISIATLPPTSVPASKTTTNPVEPPSNVAARKVLSSTKSVTSKTSLNKPSIFIQAIPPFKRNKPRISTGPPPATNGTPSNSDDFATPSASTNEHLGTNVSVSPAIASSWLDDNVSSLGPDIKRNAFTHGGPSANTATSASNPGSSSASPEPEPKPETMRTSYVKGLVVTNLPVKAPNPLMENRIMTPQRRETTERDETLHQKEVMLGIQVEELQKREEELKRREMEVAQEEKEWQRQKAVTEKALALQQHELKAREEALQAREMELEIVVATQQKSAILFKLRLILLDTTTRTYRQLLRCVGADAQTMLDVFQLLLDTGDFPDRGQLIAAMRRLSAKARIYPQRYILDEPIQLVKEYPVNSGRFADIYQAEFRGIMTCLKVIRVHAFDLAQHMAKVYAKEAILWCQLSHPNILPFYGLCMFRDIQVAFVAPWAENGNLSDFLAKEPRANRVFLCLDTAAGVEYLHANDVVHGDLKALNILVDASGKACLSDFGLSGVTDKDIVRWATQSSVASKGGTARWQAPELHNEVSDIHNTKATDVFAWASTCYEAFTGNPPYFEIRGEATVALKIIRGDLPTRPAVEDLSWTEKGLTEDIWDLLVDCWKTNASDRPNMSTVITRLDREKPGIDLRPPGQWKSGAAMRFNTDAEERRPSLDDLDVILTRVMDQSIQPLELSGDTSDSAIGA